MTEPTSYSICVATLFFNEEKNLPNLLRSFEVLKGHEELSRIKFLFIDNHSQDSSCDVVKKWAQQNKWCELELLHRAQNNIAEARQQVLEKTQAEWVLFIDGDTELEADWLSQVIRSIELSDEDTVAIGGLSSYVPRRGWHEFVLPLENYFPMGKKFDLRVGVDHVPTNNCLLRRSVALSVGGFHPFFKYVGEDLDLSVRLRENHKIIYDPSFGVKHTLGLDIFSWYRKMALYGRAQSFVSIKNRGGVPVEKFIPLLFALFVLISFIFNPLLSLSVSLVILLIPRIRFYTLTILFYGLGEFIGALIGVYHFKLKSNFREGTQNRELKA